MGGAFPSGYTMPSHFLSLPLPWATDEQVQGGEHVIALLSGTQNYQPVGETGQDQGGGGFSKGRTERGLCRLREIVGGLGDGCARHTYTHAQIHTQMADVTPEELIGIRAAVAEMEWVLLSWGWGKGGERDGKGHDTPLSLHSPSPPGLDIETADRFQALAELLEMQLNSTSAELTHLRVRCGQMEDETSVLSEKLRRYEDIVAKVQGDIMVERNLRLALASVFDDLSRLLREVLKGVSAFNATAAAARGARGEEAAAGGGRAADGGGSARESQGVGLEAQMVGLEASPLRLGGVSPGVLQVSPMPSTSVVAAVSLIAAQPPASELAAEAVSAASAKAMIGAMAEFARKLEEEWRLQLQALHTHHEVLVVTGECDTDESQDLRAMLGVMRQKEEREEARERERAQEKYAREELGKSIKYFETISSELADATIREQQLSDGLEQMAQESETLGVALKSRDEYIAELLEQQQPMKEQEMTLSQEVAQVSAALANEAAERDKLRDSLTYVRWVLAGRVLP